jgi:hypothetical protein
LPPSPANGWSCARSGLKTFADLTPATGARTTRFCRPLQHRSSCAFADRSRENPPCDSVCARNAAASTASHPNVRDDREAPLMRDGMRAIKPLIWGAEKRFIFLGRAGQDSGKTARRANHLTQEERKVAAAQLRDERSSLWRAIGRPPAVVHYWNADASHRPCPPAAKAKEGPQRCPRWSSSAMARPSLPSKPGLAAPASVCRYRGWPPPQQQRVT